MRDTLSRIKFYAGLFSANLALSAAVFLLTQNGLFAVLAILAGAVVSAALAMLLKSLYKKDDRDGLLLPA